ncbi:hypothetical protein ALC60_02637 [Trachymyrmex zeteki]|uniref:Uncharacterized protein n=1 Tax=Mycetomoellerius zeteki TaxID=64791 RepID=A0A151XCY2_9HYME|nr:hypothetical protein ALC60_02637 [Trachymyrmex zeteki]
MLFIKKPRFAFIGEYGGSVRCWALLGSEPPSLHHVRYPFYPQREKLLDGKLNGSARKKLRLRRDFNVIRECARIALILERRGNDKAHLPLVFHVIKHYR